MYKTPDNLFDFSYEKIDDLASKRVIIRSCLNVTVDETGKVTDATRIKEAVAGIKYFAENAKQIIIIGHLGRPEKYSKELSFWNVAEIIEQELGMEVEFVPFQTVSLMQSKVILSDNIRFFEDEENKEIAKRESFAKELAGLGDIFVNDAFADYRESASTYDIAKFLPSFVGPLFLKEVDALSKFEQPQRQFVAVLGGAKLSEKLDAMKALCDIADKVLVGGAMAYTLMKAKGVNIGKSLVEEDKINVAKEIVEKYSGKLVLPIDHIVVSEFNEDAPTEYLEGEEISENKIGVDIGEKTVNLFLNEISQARTILWNGPMGVFEWEHSSNGTKSIGEAISQNNNAYSLAGGGDSIAAINKFNLTKFNHISTGGGAMLAFIAYDKFPTLDVIVNK